MIPLIIQDQFYTIQNLQRSPISQTSNWSGTFFAYSKPALGWHLMQAKNFFIVNLLCIYPFRFLAIPPALVSIMIVDSIEDILSRKRERYDIT